MTTQGHTLLETYYSVYSLCFRVLELVGMRFMLHLLRQTEHAMEIF